MFGQTRAPEGIENLGIVHIGKRELIEIVRLHEFLEQIGAEHHGLGNHDGGVVEAIDFGVGFDEIVDESQTAPFAAERTFADAGEIGVAVETIAAEYGDDTAVFHQPILHDGFKDDAPVGIEVAQFFPRELFHKLGRGKQRATAEPTRNVVARDVIEERIGRHTEDGVLHLLEIAGARHFLERAGVAKHEIAEAEMLFHGTTQIDGHLFGVFVDESGVVRRGFEGIVRLGGLEDEGQERIGLAQTREEGDTGFRVDHAAARIARIGDDAEHVVGMCVVERGGFLVGARQSDLRTTAHAQRTLVLVEGFGGKLLTLLQDELIKLGQDGGVEPNVVFDEKDELHSTLFDVVIEVHLVLEQLDDGEEQIGVAQPAEHIFEGRKIFVLDARRDAVAEGGEHNDGDVLVARFDVAGDVEGVAVVRSGHDDDEVERVLPQFAPSLVGGAHLGEARRIAQREGGIFVEEFFVDASVVFEHESIVGVGDEQNIKDTPCHEIDERRIFQIELRKCFFVEHSVVRGWTGVA